MDAAFKEKFLALWKNFFNDAALPITLVSACAADVYDKPLLSVAVARQMDPGKLVKETGADVAYKTPAKIAIDAYQTSLMASMYGSTGDLLPALDDQERKRRSMQLVKSRFRNVDKLLIAGVDAIDAVVAFTPEEL